MTAAERVAVKDDAARRLRELEAVRQALWPDRDDAAVQSELTVIESELRAAEHALRTSDVERPS